MRQDWFWEMDEESGGWLDYGIVLLGIWTAGEDHKESGEQLRSATRGCEKWMQER